MKRSDKFEIAMLIAYDRGVLKSISPTKADLAKLKAAASASNARMRIP